MPRDSDKHPGTRAHPLAGQAERLRRRTETRQLEAKAAARASQQGEEAALQNQVDRRTGSPPNADQAPRTADSGTMRPATGEVRATPDEQKTRHQSEEIRRGD